MHVYGGMQQFAAIQDEAIFLCHLLFLLEYSTSMAEY